MNRRIFKETFPRNEDIAKVHHFDSTDEAHDMCQIDDEIKTGDVIVVDEEMVVGLAYVWAPEVTKDHKELQCCNVPIEKLETGGTLIFTEEQVRDARRVAEKFGYELQPVKKGEE